MVAVVAAPTFGGTQDDLDIGRQLGIQLGSGLGVALYTAIASWLILKVVDALTPLRVSDNEEEAGLDVVLHDEAGYRF